MNVAEVKMWGKLVGAVAWNERTGYADFEYDPQFRQTGLDIAPLKMPVRDARSQFSFPELVAWVPWNLNLRFYRRANAPSP